MSDSPKTDAAAFTEALGASAPRVLTQDGGKSTNIHWARFYPDEERLEVDFKNKAGVKVSTYSYDGTRLDNTRPGGFTWDDWRAFCEAPSKGEHFAYKIRPRFLGMKK
jgi:hypothetical protein